MWMGPRSAELGAVGTPEAHFLAGAEGGTRTHTGIAPQQILSLLCLPFHHSGTAPIVAQPRGIALADSRQNCTTSAESRSTGRWTWGHAG